LPAIHSEALLVAGLVWLSAFGIFVLIYGPMLVGCGTECLLSGAKRTFGKLLIAIRDRSRFPLTLPANVLILFS
jgi:hypothetical protein